MLGVLNREYIVDKRFLLVLAAVVLALALGGPAALAQSPVDQSSIPFRPIDPSYWSIKSALDAQAPREGAASNGPLTHSPSLLLNWEGLKSTGPTPSDAVGAIGPTEYIELVNTSIAVYNRSKTRLSSNTQAGWTGKAYASGDAVVEWSPPDNRFYASMLFLNRSTGNYRLIFGYSKGPIPSAAASAWCFYTSDFGGRYGRNLPDYPKLGDTADFMLIGVNTFLNGATYGGSDVAWVAKPAHGVITTCPKTGSFKTGVKQNLRNADGTPAFTPNPTKQTDSSSTGYVVANKDPGKGTSTVLSLFTVTKSGSGTPVFSPAKTVTVPSFSYPPNAPQKGTTKVLDTMDGRLNSAWASPDPSQAGAVALWTGHTVNASAGGLGAEYRWYEINPATGALFRSGKVQSSSLYVFTGAIAPDRNGTTGTFGSNALMAFNTSSASAYPAAAMASVVSGVQSGIVTVALSPRAENDFSCKPVCRWGDYSGASPDPASIAAGQVWSSAMLTSSTGNWTTWNWAAAP